MGKEEDENFRRMQEGISLEEVSGLLRTVQIANPIRYEDPRAQLFSDLWFSQKDTLTIEQKSSIGFVYISKVLRLGDEVAEKFVEGDLTAYHEVGLKQSGIPSNTDTSGFWEEIGANYPEIYTNQDVRFLSETGGVFAVLHLLSQLEVPLAEQSPVLRSLAVNAHAYK